MAAEVCAGSVLVHTALVAQEVLIHSVFNLWRMERENLSMRMKRLKHNNMSVPNGPFSKSSVIYCFSPPTE